MSNDPDNTNQLAAMQRALYTIKELRTRLDALEGAKSEPIAIVGMGCRFPGGADSPDAFWRLLHDGVDAISEVPAERWSLDEFYDPDPAAPGKMYTRYGSFLKDVDRFDAAFFGISPREAVSMDPQQRLLLEVAWEALENAGQSPDKLAGSQTGVFVGISTNDYLQLHWRLGDERMISPYQGTGNAFSVAPGRLAYTLGLQGPCMAVDTACSSSLVALHVACQSLRSGECQTALVGGVNLILSPIPTINFCKARMMAPDGRCKTFDARADGYVRGEGCGVVVLKRLSSALANGDRVLAVIRGSAVNQDGRSGGLTAPNGPAQEAVIRKALEEAKVEPGKVGYVEAHGTGTALGDPIELRALAAVMADGRAAEQPLVVGSVKTSIGHLEAAAGMASLIKVVLALQHRQIPPHLHFDRPNPYVAWDRLPLVIPRTEQAWQPIDSRRLAGLSSFGFSGTNAHVVLEEAPVSQPAEQDPDRPLHLLTLSAKDEVALRSLAGRWASSLATLESGDKTGPALGDAAFTANAGRAHLSQRLAIIASSAEQASSQLAGFAAGVEAAGLESGVSTVSTGLEVAFLFTGQGAQYVGMGRRLFETQPTFRQALERCDEILRRYLEKPLLSVIYPEPGADSPIDKTAYTQPALFSLQYALAEMWRSWGVIPAAVIGHSVGEFAAACVAGVFGLEDGLRLVAERGRLMQALPGGGGMAAVFAPEAQVAAAVVPYANVLAISALNGPNETVISGAQGAVDAVCARFQANGTKTWPLTVSHAFHSPLMEPMLPAFARVTAEVRYTPPQIALVSNVSGRLANGEVAEPGYWIRHARQPVRFAAGMQALAAEGYRAFLEIGPTPTLLGLARRGVPDQGQLWLPSLRKGRDDWQQLLETLAALYVTGADVDWAGFDRGYRRRRLSLPTYAFQRQRFWLQGAGLTAALMPAQPPASAEAAAAEPGPSDSLLYDRMWQLKPLGQAGQQQPEGRWLILADRNGVGAALASELAALGHSPVLLSPAENAENARAQVRATLGEAGADWRGAAFLGLLDETLSDEPVAAAGAAAQFVSVAQALLEAGSTAPTLWVATRQAQAVSAADGPAAVAQAPAWGLGRVLALEHPEIWGGMVDLESGSGPAKSAEALLNEMLRPDGEDQIAYRAGERYTARLIRRQAGDMEAQVPAFRPDASYLIAGDCQGEEVKLAGWMAAHGARHLLLAGSVCPDGPEGAAESDRQALAELGTAVELIRVNIDDQAELAALLARMNAEQRPLRGVIYLPNVPRRQALRDLSRSEFEDKLRPVFEETWSLHELTREAGLDFFVLFSSVSSVWGSRELGEAAAAHSWLDALARHRASAGLPALSINWGPWTTDGWASAEELAQLARIGVTALEPGEAMDALGYLLQANAVQATVARVDWRIFKPVYEAKGRRPLLAELAPEAREIAGEQPAAQTELARRLQEISPRERRSRLVAYIQENVAAVLGLEAEQRPEPHQGFFEMGMDSLMAVELKSRLQTALGQTLPATLTFDYPSIDAVAGYVLREVLRLENSDVAGAASLPQARTAEPIAIIGLACRFPGGANDPETFWKLLAEGRDAIAEVPADRWSADAHYDPDPDVPRKMYTRYGGFLKTQADTFDARFFGITPREATNMDPQQRLLLEVAWEALENAGQAPDRLVGSPTGVFVGINTSDYMQLISADPSAEIDAYVATGNTFSVAAGRVSYFLGLQGPSIALDTACSSSLVTVHLACQSLRSGECKLALAGGVNLMLSPATTVSMAKLRALSPDGRCKTFDASADGYGRGEGCGMVVLKPLSAALADGDPILALIRGSAVNQDGRSSGLTVPNGPAQQALIRDALAISGVGPAEIDYVEAHGTGTPLGDPIEIQALEGALGQGRDAAAPLLVGSVKTNIGHLEAAAGVAALIKVVLAMQHQAIPPHLHFEKPNPYVDWDQVHIRVPTALTPWPAGGARRVAGVSSFGFSGTNAHVVVEEAPAAPRDCPLESEPQSSPRAGLLPLSARSEEALRATARAYRAFLRSSESSGIALQDIFYTAGMRRSHHDHRLAMVGRSPVELAEGLEAFLQGAARPGLAAGRRDPSGGSGVVLVFSGQGSHWIGMGRDLLADEPSFRAALEACDAAMRPHVDWSLLDELQADSGRLRLEEIDVVQPAIFAVQVGLAALWRSWGIEPAAVVGYGMGEVAAAHVAGALALDDAARIVCYRSRLMKEKSGEMDTVGQNLAAALTDLQPARAAVPLYSTVTGAVSDGLDLDAGYWARNVRDPVLFASTVQQLLAAGLTVFLELSPHPIALNEVESEMRQAGQAGTALASLERGRAGRGTLLTTLARLYTLGCTPDWSALYPGRARVAPLPTYPWQRKRFWLQQAAKPEGLATQSGGTPACVIDEHTLLRNHFKSARPAGEHFWEVELNRGALPYLDEHRIEETPVTPLAAYTAIALAAAEQALGPGQYTLEEVQVHRSLVVAQGIRPALQLIVTPQAEKRACFEIYGREPGSAGQPTLYADGRINEARHEAGERPRNNAVDRLRAGDEMPGEAFYADVQAAGLQLGPSYRGIARLWRGAGEALAELQTAPGSAGGSTAADGLGEHGRTGLYPALLETCYRVLAAALPDAGEAMGYLPVGLDRLEAHARPADVMVWCHATLELYDAAGFQGSVQVLDSSGRPIAEASGLKFAPLDETGIQAARQERLNGWLYDVEWQPKPRPEEDGASTVDGRGLWLVFADQGNTATALTRKVEEQGGRCLLVYPGTSFRQLAEGRWEVNPAAPGDFSRLIDAAHRQGVLRGVIHLWGSDTAGEITLTTLRQAQAVGVDSVLHLTRALAAQPGPADPRLWLVTRGLHPAGPLVGPLAVEQAPLWGLGKVVALEQPDLWGGMIDLDMMPSANEASLLYAEISAPDGEDEIAWRDGQRYVARLLRGGGDQVKSRPMTWRSDSTYLITGGLGSLGLALAGLLVDKGVRHLLLTGRRGLPERATWGTNEHNGETAAAITAIQAMEARGAIVRVVAADVADYEQMAAVLAPLGRAQPPLRGIIHAAGVFTPQSLADISLASLHAVLRPKVEGTWVLHELTQELDLDFFVLFSSAASMWGSGLAGHYVAANYFQDALALHRRSLGLPALSINWGWWADSNMVPADAQKYFAAIGLNMMEQEQGFAALQFLLGTESHRVAVAAVDWSKYKPVFEAKRRRPLLDLIKFEPAVQLNTATEDRLRLLNQLEVASPGERLAVLVAYTQGEVARVMGLDPDQPPEPRQGFAQMGMNSLMAVELKTRLEASLGRSLPATIAFEHPTIEALAGYLGREVLEVSLTEDTSSGRGADAQSTKDLPDLEQYSEDELLALLANELQTKELQTKDEGGAR